VSDSEANPGMDPLPIPDRVSRTSPTSIHQRDWRDSRWLALVEFVLVALIFYADHRSWIPIS